MEALWREIQTTIANLTHARDSADHRQTRRAQRMTIA